MKPLIDFASLNGGNLDVYSEAYEAYVKKIYDFLFYKTFEKEIAEDLTQETFLKALKKIRTFHGSTAEEFSSWIYSIAYNTYIDHLRTKKETLELDGANDKMDYQDLGKMIDNKSKIHDILTFLDSVGKTNKDIVIMRIWDDLSYKEISRITGKSEDNCKKIVSRTLHQIQANLALIFFICTLNF